MFIESSDAHDGVGGNGCLAHPVARGQLKVAAKTRAGDAVGHGVMLLLLMNPNGEQSVSTQRELNLITDDKLAWLELPGFFIRYFAQQLMHIARDTPRAHQHPLLMGCAQKANVDVM